MADDEPNLYAHEFVPGYFTFDFTAWSGMFLAIRSVIIAIAGFVAYKIIFVGGRA